MGARSRKGINGIKSLGVYGQAVAGRHGRLPGTQRTSSPAVVWAHPYGQGTSRRELRQPSPMKQSRSSPDIISGNPEFRAKDCGRMTLSGSNSSWVVLRASMWWNQTGSASTGTSPKENGYSEISGPPADGTQVARRAPLDRNWLHGLVLSRKAIRKHDNLWRSIATDR